MNSERNQKLNNGGFSLVELLVAVLILAIIVSPLLQSFVTSAKTAAKSRAMGDATLAAQNIAETIEATHLKKLLSALRDGTAASTFSAQSVTDATFYDEDGNEIPIIEPGAEKYTFKLNGVSSSKSNFDAIVTLDANDFASANDVYVTEYTPMDAVFSQPSDLFENPDWLAANEFSDEAVALSNTNYSSDYFLDKMKRRVDIYVDEDVSTGETIVTTTYTYTYNFTYTLEIYGDDGQLTTTEKSKVLSADYSYEFFRSSTAGGLVSLYFFYYPNYTATASGLTPDDTINIYNTNDLEFSAFIIKQKSIVRVEDAAAPGSYVGVSTMGEDELNSKEIRYYALIALRESLMANDPNAIVYSNINKNISSKNITNVAINVPYRIYGGDTWYTNGTISGELVAKNQQNRIYDITIDIYRAGTDEPVFTLNASKLD